MTLEQFRKTRREVPDVFAAVDACVDEKSAGCVYCSNPEFPNRPTVYIEKPIRCGGEPSDEGFLQIGREEIFGTLHDLERELYAYCLTELHFGEI